MKRILITGATGFVGRYAVEEFASHDYEVIGFARRKEKGLNILTGDITDAERVKEVVEETTPTHILHLAGFSSVGESWKHKEEVFAVNVEGTRNLFEAAGALSSPPRILVVSSGELYHETQGRGARETDPLDGDSPYAESRIQQEKLVRSFNTLESIVTRSFNHTGPGQPPPRVIPHFAAQIAKIERGEQEPVMNVGNLEVSRDFLDVRDVVHAYRLLLEIGKPCEIYNVASGIPQKVDDVLTHLLSLSKTDIRIESDPKLFRPVDCPVRYGDNTKLKEATGWKPAIPFTQTLRDVLEYWRSA